MPLLLAYCSPKDEHKFATMEVYMLQTTNVAKQNKANGLSTEYDTIPFVVNGTSNVEISLQPWPI